MAGVSVVLEFVAVNGFVAGDCPVDGLHDKVDDGVDIFSSSVGVVGFFFAYGRFFLLSSSPKKSLMKI